MATRLIYDCQRRLPHEDVCDRPVKREREREVFVPAVDTAYEYKIVIPKRRIIR